MGTKHTPTPWKHGGGTYVVSNNSDGPSIAKTTALVGRNDAERKWKEDEAIENAKFIVRAVNNYQSMLDALKSVDLCDVKSIARVKIRNAILQAEGN